MVSRFCEADAPSVQFVRGDCHAMPFQDGRFDLVMCRSVLEHLEDPQAVFCEVARVLAPGAILCFLRPIAGITFLCWPASSQIVFINKWSA